jgi:hypothetical protein
MSLFGYSEFDVMSSADVGVHAAHRGAGYGDRVAYRTAFIFKDWLEGRVELLNLGQLAFVVWIPLMVLTCSMNRGAVAQLVRPDP